MSGQASNSRTYTKRPPANCRGARCAWDILTNEYHAKGRTLVEMYRAHMDHWVWVGEYEDGEYEEVDALIVRHCLRPQSEVP